MIQLLLIQKRLLLRENVDIFFFNAAKKVLRIIPHSRVALEVNNNQHDGAGAQVQRIASVFSLAKAIGIEFDFQQIMNIEVQHGDSYLDENDLQFFVADLNEWLKPLSIDKNEMLSISLQISSSGFKLFFALLWSLITSSFSQRTVKLQIPDAYWLTNRYPELYKYFGQTMNLNDSKEVFSTTDETIDIQIHIRASTLKKGSERYLEPESVLACLSDIYASKKLNKSNCTINIHTDCWLESTDNELVLRHASSETMEYWKKLGIIDSQGAIDKDLIATGLELIEKINASYPNVAVYPPQSPINAWNTMALADVLLISKSSFSFVGAILNTHGDIWTPNFWIAPLPNWKKF